jgi:hypothetical protein
MDTAAAADHTPGPMTTTHPMSAAVIALCLLATPSAFGQAEPSPTAAEVQQEVPLMQLEAPPERVTAPAPAPAPLSAPEPAPPPACEVSAAPSPCTQPADAYRHDGFYFRVSNETQYLAFLGRGPEGDASVKGLGSSGMLAIGGTPVPGLVIAGTLGSSMLRGKFKGRPQDQAEEEASVASAMLGVLLDWYPLPDDGWHVGAALGFAGITLTDSAIADAVGPAFAAKIFGGYDFWIGPQWSLGLAAVLSATPTTSLVDDEGDKNGYRFHTLSAGVAGSLVLH